MLLSRARFFGGTHRDSTSRMSGNLLLLTGDSKKLPQSIAKRFLFFSSRLRRYPTHEDDDAEIGKNNLLLLRLISDSRKYSQRITKCFLSFLCYWQICLSAVMKISDDFTSDSWKRRSKGCLLGFFALLHPK